MVLGLEDVQRFRGGLVFKAYRLLYHATPGLRVIKKKKYNQPLYRTGFGVYLAVSLSICAD